MSAQGETAMSADERDIILSLKNKLSEKHVLDTHEMVVGATLRLIELALSAPSPAATVAEGVAEPVAWQPYYDHLGRWVNIIWPPEVYENGQNSEDGLKHRWRPLYAHPAPSGPADARVRLMGIADDFHPDRPQDAQLALDEMRAAIQALVDDIAVWNVHLAKADLMARLNTLSEVRP